MSKFPLMKPLTEEEKEILKAEEDEMLFAYNYKKTKEYKVLYGIMYQKLEEAIQKAWKENLTK